MNKDLVFKVLEGNPEDCTKVADQIKLLPNNSREKELIVSYINNKLELLTMISPQIELERQEKLKVIRFIDMQIEFLENKLMTGRVDIIEDKYIENCLHKWLIDPGDKLVSEGQCQKCGKVKEFKNWIDTEFNIE